MVVVTITFIMFYYFVFVVDLIGLTILFISFQAAFGHEPLGKRLFHQMSGWQSHIMREGFGLDHPSH